LLRRHNLGLKFSLLSLRSSIRSQSMHASKVEAYRKILVLVRLENARQEQETKAWF